MREGAVWFPLVIYCLITYQPSTGLVQILLAQRLEKQTNQEPAFVLSFNQRTTFGRHFSSIKEKKKRNSMDLAKLKFGLVWSKNWRRTLKGPRLIWFIFIQINRNSLSEVSQRQNSKCASLLNTPVAFIFIHTKTKLYQVGKKNAPAQKKIHQISTKVNTSWDLKQQIVLGSVKRAYFCPQTSSNLNNTFYSDDISLNYHPTWCEDVDWCQQQHKDPDGLHDECDLRLFPQTRVEWPVALVSKLGRSVTDAYFHTSFR